MRARIERADSPAYASIQHVGEFRDGVPTATTDSVGAYESYTLDELPNGTTRLEVELSKVPDEYVDMMNQMAAGTRALRELCVA